MSSLDYPFPPLPRVAVFSLPVVQTRHIRVFRPGEWKALERFRPEALAAWHSDLVLIGQLYRSGVLALPDLSAPFLVFSHPDSGPLTSAQYDQLWALFGLPLFEQLRDSSGRLLAQECEARQGFHLPPHTQPAQALFPFDATPLASPCPCGRPDPLYRLKPMLTACA
jgi:hypothetical protein